MSFFDRLEKKVRVALDWTLDLFFRKDFVQYLTPQPPVMSTQQEPHMMVGKPRDGGPLALAHANRPGESSA